MTDISRTLDVMERTAADWDKENDPWVRGWLAAIGVIRQSWDFQPTPWQAAPRPQELA